MSSTPQRHNHGRICVTCFCSKSTLVFDEKKKFSKYSPQLSGVLWSESFKTGCKYKVKQHFIYTGDRYVPNACWGVSFCFITTVFQQYALIQEQELISKYVVIYKNKATFSVSQQLHVSACGSMPLSLLCVLAEWRYYGSVEQLVTGRKNLTRPPLWISCLWPSFVIPNWVPYIQSLGRFSHVNRGLRAPRLLTKMLSGPKTVPEMHCRGGRGAASL